jgi:hypothetical protein
MVGRVPSVAAAAAAAARCAATSGTFPNFDIRGSVLLYLDICLRLPPSLFGKDGYTLLLRGVRHEFDPRQFDAQNVPSFGRWRFEMKRRPFSPDIDVTNFDVKVHIIG